jgi:protein-disulfide isomerase
MKDIVEAKRLGIEGTPTFIINGKMFRGLIGLEDFRQIIESELKISQKSFGK